jgi:hypothetical protein
MSKDDVTPTPTPRLISFGSAKACTNAFLNEPVPEEIGSTLGVPD